MLQRLIARLEPSNTSAVIVLDSQYGPGFVHIAKIHLSRQDSIGQAVSTHTTMRKGDFGSDQGSRRPRSHVFSSSCPQVIAAVGLLTLSVRILSARTYFLPDHPPLSQVIIVLFAYLASYVLQPGTGDRRERSKAIHRFLTSDCQ